MPTRNVVLTDSQAQFVEHFVAVARKETEYEAIKAEIESLRQPAHCTPS